MVITNYDNFKNADFFINQYFKAQEMIKEVDDFFKSFYISKLLTAKDMINIHPISFGGGNWADICWTNKIVSWNLVDSCHAYELSDHYDPKAWGNSEKDIDKIRQCVNKNILKCMSSIYKRMNNEFDCYYVLDEKNKLYEFIPVAAKDSIKVNFKSTKSDNIIIEGSYYEYLEIGGRWGKCEYSLNKIIKKIYINRYNNNVVKVTGDKKEINSGEVGGKNYWSKHDHYCMSNLEDDKTTVNTMSFDHVVEPMKSHIQSSMRYIGTDEEKLKLLNECHEKYDDRYRKSYGEELTDEIINQYIIKYTYYRS